MYIIQKHLPVLQQQQQPTTSGQNKNTGRDRIALDELKIVFLLTNFKLMLTLSGSKCKLEGYNGC